MRESLSSSLKTFHKRNTEKRILVGGTTGLVEAAASKSLVNGKRLQEGQT